MIAYTPPSAGTRQGITLILMSSLPILAVAGLVADLPVLLQVFRDVPRHELLVPMILTLPSLCVALFSSLAGLIADTWGRRPVPERPATADPRTSRRRLAARIGLGGHAGAGLRGIHAHW